MWREVVRARSGAKPRLSCTCVVWLRGLLCAVDDEDGGGYHALMKKKPEVLCNDAFPVCLLLVKGMVF